MYEHPYGVIMMATLQNKLSLWWYYQPHNDVYFRLSSQGALLLVNDYTAPPHIIVLESLKFNRGKTTEK